MNTPSVCIAAIDRHKSQFKPNQSNERVRIHTDVRIEMLRFLADAGKLHYRK